MEDIIQKYKKEKKVKNISIIITSLALALWLNIFLTNTDSWKYIKTSVINSQIWTIKKSDLYLENMKNSWNIMMNLKSSKEISKAKSISFSFAYNKDNVVLKDKKVSLDWLELLNVIDNDWYNTVILNFKAPTNIKVWENILHIILEKKLNQKENLNLVNSNMTDGNNDVFMLSTSGIEF